MISGLGLKVLVDSAEQLYKSRCKGLRADAVITELQMYSLILVFRFTSFFFCLSLFKLYSVSAKRICQTCLLRMAHPKAQPCIQRNLGLCLVVNAVII